MEQQLCCFSDYLSVIGYSAGTRWMIGACVREFLRWSGCGVSQLRPQSIRDFYGWLQHRPLRRGVGALSSVMIGHYVYSLKVFFGWLQQSGQLVANPMSGLRLGSVVRTLRTPLGVGEVAALFAAADNELERAVLHVYYSCGLRRSEGVSLRTLDVRTRERVLYVRRGKGHRRRVVPLAGTVAAALSAYLRQRARCATPALLVSAGGVPLDGRGCLALLQRLGQRAGLSRTVTLHDLRASIATHLLRGGMKAEQVRDFLGHRHLETTQLYARPAADQILRL